MEFLLPLNDLGEILKEAGLWQVLFLMMALYLKAFSSEQREIRREKSVCFVAQDKLLPYKGKPLRSTRNILVLTCVVAMLILVQDS